MPLDSRNKRGSAFAWNLGHGRVWANPSAGELSTQAGRQQAGRVYMGILAGLPVIVAIVNFGVWALGMIIQYYPIWLAITTSDTSDLKPFQDRNKILTDAIYVGATGDVTAVSEDGTAILFKGVPVGTFLPIRARRVNATATTATNLVACYKG